MDNRPQIDLNALRDAIIRTQRKGETTPSEAIKSVLVSRDGKMIMHGDATEQERRTLAKVQQDTFHGRKEEESEAVLRCMPSSTMQHKSPDGAEGWIYSFFCSFGELYKMFAYYDGSYYQVQVLEPPWVKNYSPHTGHILSGGRICFGLDYNSGRRTLEDAYAKSVLWATGMSAMHHSGINTFQFSINNLDQ